jgi:predicted dehydrogenase
MTLRVALLGYGYAGKTLHAPLIRATAGLELAAVGSSDAAKVHADLPGLAVGAAREVAVQSDVDLVVVATPNDTHHDLASRALAAGKHVVVDKPFTVTQGEARDLVERSEAAGRLLSVFHNARWNADFLTVRRLIADGRLGQIVHFESHYDRYRPEVRSRWRERAGPGSGIWYDLGAHLVDQALQLFGPPLAVQADLAMQRRGAEAVDYFHVVLRYDRTRVILHGSNLVAGGSPRFVIHGDKASYVKYGVDPQEAALQRGEHPGSPGWGHDPRPGVFYVPDGFGTIEEPAPTVPGDWGAYYAGVRDAVLQRGPNPVPASDALAVMRVLLHAASSADRRCELALS